MFSLYAHYKNKKIKIKDIILKRPQLKLTIKDFVLNCSADICIFNLQSCISGGLQGDDN